MDLAYWKWIFSVCLTSDSLATDQYFVETFTILNRFLNWWIRGGGFGSLIGVTLAGGSHKTCNSNLYLIIFLVWEQLEKIYVL